MVRVVDAAMSHSIQPFQGRLLQLKENKRRLKALCSSTAAQQLESSARPNYN